MNSVSELIVGALAFGKVLMVFVLFTAVEVAMQFISLTSIFPFSPRHPKVYGLHS